MKFMMFFTFVNVSYGKLGQPVVGTWTMSDDRRPRLDRRWSDDDPVLCGLVF